jgi:recombination protein RecA
MAGAKAKTKTKTKTKAKTKAKSKSKAKTKSKATPKETTKSNLDKLLERKDMKKAIKVFGSKVLRRAVEIQESNRPRWGTGNVPLDVATGGGWDPGKFHLVYGEPSGGKTYTIHKSLANAQQSCSRCYRGLDFCKCPKGPRESICALITSENDWDREWAERCGLDLDKLLICEADYGEKGLDMSDLLLRTGEVDMVVIDSLALLVPAKVIEESVSKDMVAEHSRMISRGVQKWVTGMVRTGMTTDRMPTLLCTNQTRVKIGVLFGSNETKTGGKSPQFAACTEVRFAKSSPHVVDSLPIPDYTECRFRVAKNKTSSPGVKGEFRIQNLKVGNKDRGDLCDEEWMISQARKYEVLFKDKGWQCVGKTLPNLDAVKDLLESDPVFKEAVRQALITVMVVR